MPDETTTRRTARGRFEALFGRGELVPPRFDFAFRTGGPGLLVDDWHVRRFHLREKIGQPYEAAVELLGPETDWEAIDLLGQRAELVIARGEDFARTIVGIVAHVDYLGCAVRGHHVRVTLRPALAMLANDHRSRVFQDLTVIEIAQRVIGPALERWGGRLQTGRLADEYPPLDYRVQYDETDLAFVLRVLAESGVSVLFDHTRAQETVVLCDSAGLLPSAGLDPLEPDGPTPPQIPRWHGTPDTIVVESVTAARQSVGTTPAQWSTHAWDWKAEPPRQHTTTMALRNDPSALGLVERWEPRRPNEGLRTDEVVADDTHDATRLAAERDRAAGLQLIAESTCTTLRAGSVFELEPQRRDRFAEPWCVVSIEHHGEAPGAEKRGLGQPRAATLTNTMRCVAPSLAHVPPSLPKPRAHGMTTAVVTGPEGEAIHTDAHGRVRVRMPWDNRGPTDDTSSCWLRVVQPWAGTGHSMTFVPRVGSEVAVSFVDGDPDRPICWGGLHNGAARPVHELPTERATTVLRTQHLDDPSRYHELRFNDSPGGERVSLRADGGLCETVRGPHRTTVGGCRTATCHSDHSEEIKGTRKTTVHGGATMNFLERVDLHVSESPKDPDKAGFRTTVAFGKYEVIADEGIVLRCGDSSIEISDGLITLKSPAIIVTTPGEDGANASTLSMSDGHAVTEAASIQQITPTSTLRLDDEVRLTQGPAAEVKASFELRGGDACVTARGEAALKGQSVVTVSSEVTQIDAGSLVISSGSSASVTSKEGTTVAAGGDLVLRGDFVRIN